MFLLGMSYGTQMSTLVTVTWCEKPPKGVSRGGSGSRRKTEVLKKHYLLKKTAFVTLVRDGKEDHGHGAL